MKTEKTTLYTLLSSDEKLFVDFFNSFNSNHSNLENEHLIIKLSENLNTSVEQIALFLSFADIHKKKGTSFVVICTRIDVDAFPETFNIVPTLEEAIDLLEMETIERDLGF